MKSLLRSVYRASPNFVQQFAHYPLGPFRRPGKYLNSLAYHLYGYWLFAGPLEGVQLGGGGCRIESFCNIDASVFCPADVIARVERLKLRSGSVATIYTSHTFEHVPRVKALPTLREWYRVLRPGGKLYILVPDFEALCRIYLRSLASYDEPTGRFAADQSRDIIYGGQTTKYDSHYGGYSRTTLTRMLRDVGFVDVEPFDRPSIMWAPFRDAGYAEINDEPVSLNLVATK
jgi:predicted SAM-dependent methyltransferase